MPSCPGEAFLRFLLMAVLSSFSVMGRLYERGSVEGGSNDIGFGFRDIRRSLCSWSWRKLRYSVWRKFRS